MHLTFWRKRRRRRYQRTYLVVKVGSPQSWVTFLLLTHPLFSLQDTVFIFFAIFVEEGEKVYQLLSTAVCGSSLNFKFGILMLPCDCCLFRWWWWWWGSWRRHFDIFIIFSFIYLASSSSFNGGKEGDASLSVSYIYLFFLFHFPCWHSCTAAGASFLSFFLLHRRTYIVSVYANEATEIEVCRFF